MAKFKLTDPSGAVYMVEAADADAAQAALSQLAQPSGAPAAAQQPAPAAADQGAGNSFVKGAVLGLPFGDRMIAGAQTLGARAGTGDSFDYATNLDRVRKLSGEMEADHPGAMMAGKLVGAIPTPMAGAGAAAKATTLPGKMLMSALAGGGAGAVQGLGDSPDLTDIPADLKAAAGGALGGAAIGVAMPPVARGLGALYTAVANKYRPTPGLPSGVAAKLLDAVQADGPANMQANLRRLGPEAMPADTGPSMLGKAQGAVLNSDEGRTALVDALTARRAGANGRIQSTFNDALGPAEPPSRVTAAINDYRSGLDDVNYGAAKSNAPPVDTSDLINLLDTRLKTAEGETKKALTNLRASLFQEETGPALNPDGSPQMQPGPSVRSAPQSNPLAGGKPLHLEDFIRKSGGVQDPGGDLKSMGLGHLVNKDGAPLDMMRESAAEQGYLGGDIDRAMHESTINDLLDALGETKPRYSVYDADRVFDREAYKRSVANMPRATGWTPGASVPVMETRKVPKTNVENLHNIRQGLDFMINYDKPGLGVQSGAAANLNGGLTEARGALDEALKSQVSGMPAADAASAAMAARAKAVETGTSILDSGKTAMWPETLDELYKGMQPGERAALAKGARGEIERLLDTNANDLVAGKNIIKGEGDWNRQRLSTVFGEEPTNRVINRIDTEAKFHDTANKIIENSQTAQRLAARDSLKPSPSSDSPIVAPASTGAGMGLTLLKRGGGKLLSALLDRSEDPQVQADVARVLAAQGPQAQGYTSALVDALARRSAGEATGRKFGNRGALAAAIAANDYRTSK